jgi:hypothetical protein
MCASKSFWNNYQLFNVGVARMAVHPRFDRVLVVAAR